LSTVKTLTAPFSATSSGSNPWTQLNPDIPVLIAAKAEYAKLK
jgi:hypothetical protein